MKTLLPFPDFEECAQALHTEHLERQCIDAMELLNKLAKKDCSILTCHSWVKMWVGYELALSAYTLAMLNELEVRTNVNQNDRIDQVIDLVTTVFKSAGDKPWWLGQDLIHGSHRGYLIYQRRDYYGPEGKDWQDPPTSLLLTADPCSGSSVISRDDSSTGILLRGSHSSDTVPEDR